MRHSLNSGPGHGSNIIHGSLCPWASDSPPGAAQNGYGSGKEDQICVSHKNDRLSCSGYGIVSALVERMTAQDPLECQPAALDGTIFFNGLQSVLGTGGIVIAAGRKTGRNTSSIESNHPKHQLLHVCSSKRSSFLHSFKNVLFSSFQGAVAVLPRATRMIS